MGQSQFSGGSSVLNSSRHFHLSYKWAIQHAALYKPVNVLYKLNAALDGKILIRLVHIKGKSNTNLKYT